MLVGGLALVGLVHESLSDAVRATAEVRAGQVAELDLAPGAAISATSEAEEELVQIVDASGTVRNATPATPQRDPMANLTPGSTAKVHVEGQDGSYLVVATHGSPRTTVLVARSMEDVDASTQLVAVLLAVGLPLLLAVVAGTTWFVVGRALAPVENIRREVEVVTGEALERRVPEPASRDEINRLAVTMNGMLERLEQSRDRQRTFVSDASHELRSPIAAIRQFTEAARSHPESVDLMELTDATLAESLRAQGLVDNLLVLARADENGLDRRRSTIDLDDLVLDEARHLRATTELTVDTSQVSAGRVRGNPTYLRQLLRNLADNAARHAKSRIALALRERDDRVELVVDDDGPGIPPEARDQVFERFVRLDHARARAAGGAGLGLAIVAEIVAAHAGTITVSEAPGGGARFLISLPCLNA